MTTVCRDHPDVEVRPGRTCPACRGWTPPPAPTPSPSAATLPLIEDTFRLRRAAGTWPSHLPVPTDPARPRRTRGATR